VSTDNPSVLAYVRSHRGTEGGLDADGGPGQREDTVLCVCNLSRFAQPAELPLQWWAGKVPVELLGRVPFPRIGELSYFITLGPHSFYWFQLTEGAN
jgi:maltose alpha-D-glucosyltransferase / alpha-amylase